MQRNSWEKQFSALKKILLMTYNAEKKSYTIICGGKNFLLQRFGKKLLPQNYPYPPPPQTSNGHVNHLGGRGRNGFDTSGLAFIKWWFSKLKFPISRLKIRL